MLLPIEVLKRFGLEDSKVTLLHQGENTSYKIENRQNPQLSVIKQYRNDRPRYFSPEGEVNWLLANLAQTIPSSNH